MKGMPDKHINKQPIFVLMKTVAVELEQFDFLEFQLRWWKKCLYFGCDETLTPMALKIV